MHDQPQPDHHAPLRARIEALWEARDTISPLTGGEDRLAIETALAELDCGRLRVAERQTVGGEESWLINVWLKQAVLLSFRLEGNTLFYGPGGVPAFDKIPLKFAGWGVNRFTEAGFRVVPGAIVRRSAYVAPGVVLMPCFVNLGAP